MQPDGMARRFVSLRLTLGTLHFPSENKSALLKSPAVHEIEAVIWVTALASWATGMNGWSQRSWLSGRDRLGQLANLSQIPAPSLNQSMV
jgi:hypothetical protein